MLKIGSEVGQPDTRYLSRSIVALNLERSWARTTRVTLVWSHPLLSPFLPSIWRELTTRRLHGQSLEPQGWLEVCLKLRHWPDSVINSIYRCVRVYARVSRVTSKCDRPTPRARACVCSWYTKRCWPRFYWRVKGNRESKIARRGKKNSVTATISRCWDAVGKQVEKGRFFNFLWNCISE